MVQFMDICKYVAANSIQSYDVGTVIQATFLKEQEHQILVILIIRNPSAVLLSGHQLYFRG
jgi:hypothetical protein